MKDGHSRLKLAMDAARSQGLSYGVKLVRAAYLARERKTTELLASDVPVFSSIKDTHDSYNRRARCAIESLHLEVRDS